MAILAGDLATSWRPPRSDFPQGRLGPINESATTRQLGLANAAPFCRFYRGNWPNSLARRVSESSGQTGLRLPARAPSPKTRAGVWACFRSPELWIAFASAQCWERRRDNRRAD